MLVNIRLREENNGAGNAKQNSTCDTGIWKMHSLTETGLTDREKTTILTKRENGKEEGRMKERGETERNSERMGL